MRRAKLLLLSGLWVAVLPYLGFPHFLKNILFSLSGLGVVYLSYVLYAEYTKGEGDKNFDNFSENSDWSN
jgi:hypothetical protein